MWTLHLPLSKNLGPFMVLPKTTPLFNLPPRENHSLHHSSSSSSPSTPSKRKQESRTQGLRIFHPSEFYRRHHRCLHRASELSLRIVCCLWTITWILACLDRPSGSFLLKRELPLELLAFGFPQSFSRHVEGVASTYAPSAAARA